MLLKGINLLIVLSIKTNEVFPNIILKSLSKFQGILMEQVTNNGPKFHLTNSNNEFLDGNNWSHCTMYMFFIFAGIADILTLKVSKYTPKGKLN